tara:strand:- start:4923 stop:5897 length:975 start_codon:yes stop_codon:yes gene_type:complete
MNTPKRVIKVGVVGAGSMGKNHVRVATSNPLMDCIGLFDPSETIGRNVATLYSTKYFPNYQDMLDEVEAVVIASPTTTHFDMAKLAIENGKHCLIEKPITVTVEEGEKLLALAEQYNVTIEVGHVERYNPVYSELIKILESEEILAVKANRLSFNVSRANDVDVVLDLMIHDLDTINQLLGGDLEVKGAIGATFLSPSNDYVNALFKGRNGMLAEVTASKVSQTKQRDLTISCSDCFIKVDYLRKEIEINRHAVSKYVSDEHNVKYKHESLVERVYVPNSEPLMAEHVDFAESIIEGREPIVTGHAGLSTLKLAIEVQKQCVIL